MVQQWKSSVNFGQPRFIAASIIIQYEFSGTTLDFVKVQYILHQMWGP